MASPAAATTDWDIKAQRTFYRGNETSRAPMAQRSFGSMGPDTRVSNGLVTSFQGPHVPETSAVTSPKSQRGKTEHGLIVPLFPLGVFLGSLSHIVAGVRKQTPRRPG